MDNLEQLWSEASFPAGHYPAQVRLATYRPRQAGNGPSPAVVVVPGGGYGINAPEEGHPVAKVLAELGFWAFVVYYRVAPHRFPAPFLDVCQAVRRVRELAEELPIDRGRVSLLGFSAGGHLAGLVAACHERSQQDCLSPQGSARPDRLVLVYPVVSMVDAPHIPSRENLLGREPTLALCESVSLERQVTARMPPTLLIHAADDQVVPPVHAIRFVEACRACGAEVELAMLPRGGHGFVLDTQRVEGFDIKESIVSWLCR